MKLYCAVFVFVVLLTLAEINEAKEQTLVLGARSGNDLLIEQDVIIKPARFYFKVTADYIYVQKTKYPKTITYVEVTDSIRNGKECSVRLIGGGPGRKFVQLQFESQSGSGIHSTVSVYGQ